MIKKIVTSSCTKAERQIRIYFLGILIYKELRSPAHYGYDDWRLRQ